MYCINCGKELPDQTKKCPECGQILDPSYQEEQGDGSGASVSDQKQTSQGWEDGYTYDSTDEGPNREDEETQYDSSTADGPREGYQNSIVYDYHKVQSDGNVDPDAPVKPERSGFAIASFVLSLISILCCCVWYVAIPLAILAIVFAVLSMRSKNRGLAVAGLIIGIISLVFSLFTAVVGVTAMQDENFYNEFYEEFYDEFYDDF